MYHFSSNPCTRVHGRWKKKSFIFLSSFIFPWDFLLKCPNSKENINRNNIKKNLQIHVEFQPYNSVKVFLLKVLWLVILKQFVKERRHSSVKYVRKAFLKARCSESSYGVSSWRQKTVSMQYLWIQLLWKAYYEQSYWISSWRQEAIPM